MLILAYLISGLFLVILLKFFTRHFTRYYFPTYELSEKIMRGKMYIYVLLPFLVSFLMYFIFPNTERIFFVFPGLISSFLIVWPSIYYPEVLPKKEIGRKHKLQHHYLLFMLIFSVFSYAGGLTAAYMTFADFSFSDPINNHWVWISIGIVMLFFTKRFYKKVNK